jgi:hypothetical protein
MRARPGAGVVGVRLTARGHGRQKGRQLVEIGAQGHRIDDELGRDAAGVRVLIARPARQFRARLDQARRERRSPISQLGRQALRLQRLGGRGSAARQLRRRCSVHERDRLGQRIQRL